MNKNYLIAISKELRDKKDSLKKRVKSGELDENKSRFRIVAPKQLFDTSLEFQSDQWYFNGFVIDCDGRLIVVDPGVDFYSRFTSMGLSVNNIEALIVTHNHIDHTASVPVFLEKLLRNKSRNIDIFISQDAYDTKIPSYYKELMSQADHIKVIYLKDSQKHYSATILGDYSIQFLSLFHSCPDTFGFKLEINGKIVAYITDTGYAITVKTDIGVYESKEVSGNFVSIKEKHDYIKEFFSDVHIGVVNINDLDYNRHSKYHLSGWDVLDLFKDTQVQQVLLQHISPVNAEILDHFPISIPQLDKIVIFRKAQIPKIRKAEIRLRDFLQLWDT
jgi:phosphoribosyl 1,2-cyclic phosphodiesterase